MKPRRATPRMTPTMMPVRISAFLLASSENCRLTIPASSTTAEAMCLNVRLASPLLSAPSRLNLAAELAAWWSGTGIYIHQSCCLSLLARTMLFSSAVATRAIKAVFDQSSGVQTKGKVCRQRDDELALDFCNTQQSPQKDMQKEMQVRSRCLCTNGELLDMGSSLGNTYPAHTPSPCSFRCWGSNPHGEKTAPHEQ